MLWLRDFKTRLDPNFKIILLKRLKQLFSKLLWPFPKNEQTDLEIRVIFVEDLKKCQQNLDFIMCPYPKSKQQRPGYTNHICLLQGSPISPQINFFYMTLELVLENNIIRANEWSYFTFSSFLSCCRSNRVFSLRILEVVVFTKKENTVTEFQYSHFTTNN